MKIIVSVVAMVLLFCHGVRSQKYSQKFEELYKAEDLIAERKYDESISFLDDKIEDWQAEKNEKYFSALLTKARVFIYKRDSPAALSIYKKVIEEAGEVGFDSIVVITKLGSVTIYDYMGKQDSVKMIVDDVLKHPNLEGWQTSNCHTYLGQIYGFRNEIDSALYHYHKAVEIDRELADSSSFPMSCLELGTYYGEIDSQEMALKYLVDGYAYLREGKDDFKEAYFLDRFSEIYMDMGNFYQAEKYVDKNEELTSRLGMKTIRVESLLNKIDILSDRGDFQEAERLLLLADSLTNAAWVKAKVKIKGLHLDKTINGAYNPKLLQEVLDMRKGSSDQRLIRTVDLIELKTIGLQWSEKKFMEKYDELYVAHNAEKSVPTRLSFLTIKSNFYKNKGKYQQALEVKSELDILQDQQRKVNNRSLITSVETQFRTEQKNQEINFLNAQNKSKNQLIDAQRNRILIISVALALISLLLFVLWRLFQRSHRQKEIISKALKEKDLLLREIHHRVKNNLQLVSSLLTLQGRSITDDAAQKAIQEGKNRVMSMALIHQDLYNKESLTGIGIKEYIDKLTRELIFAYNVNEEKIHLDLDVEDMDLDVDTLVPIGLILNELLTNSFKYAFEENKEGVISIRFKEDNNELKVTVADNGKGYNPDQINKDSFGNILIQSLVAQLDGRLSVDTSKGTRTEMVFKDYKLM